MKKILLPVALTAIALAGCSSEEPSTSTAAPASTAPSSAAPSSAAPSSAAPSAPAASASVGKDGCPVDAATLKKAYEASKKVSEQVILGKGFAEISCYQGWATALTQPEQMDVAVVVFKYDTGKKSWTALVGGTDNPCRNLVPPTVQSKLKHCNQ
ncbi:hypothetical protein KZZ52_08305 [Dactylosporangium sp. AC04546]|uniref:hypothetical protein n=1 Tax=Dactylosporangium sp. AC04546 TaxID=2862460 RepID=UPI001EDCE975|nr:hypothetical protein [Dactylosporangium sp. AC04546]WVK85378.1 hypothetical protein KZZ52_08305 [Dactylosporangium sp. AC04546]